MGLLDRLESARAAQDGTRTSLRDSALSALANAEDAASVETAWTLMSAQMDSIFTDPSDVASLRQTILQLAVRGRLVPQDASDEPACVLLERIAAEKARLVAEKKIRKPKALPPIEADEVPFEVPEGWEWCRFPDIALWAVGSGFPKKYQGHDGLEFLFAKVSDMNRVGNERFIHTTANTINTEIRQQIRANIHPPNTVVFPKIGGAIATNKRRIVVTPTAIDNNCLGLTPLGELDSDWLFMLLTSIDFTLYQSGTAVPALSQGTLDCIISASSPRRTTPHRCEGGVGNGPVRPIRAKSNCCNETGGKIQVRCDEQDSRKVNICH